MHLVTNLPKFKTHSLTRITGAVKHVRDNTRRTKTLLHTKFIDVENSMKCPDAYLSNVPAINIMDGIIGLKVTTGAS